MANISTAAGNIILMANDESVIKALNSLFDDYTSKWVYNTTVLDRFERDDSFLEGEPYKMAYLAAFQGTGRWSYGCNLDYFFSWILNDFKNHPEKERRKEVLDLLTASDFGIRFEFTDEEGGMMLLYTAEMRMDHEANTPLTSTRIATTNEEYFEYNAKNLTNLGMYEDVWDGSDPMFFDDWVICCERDDDVSISMIKDFHGLPMETQKKIMKKLRTRFDDEDIIHYDEYFEESEPDDVWNYLLKILPKTA